jgi:histidyl-tRNA synthetase
VIGVGGRYDGLMAELGGHDLSGLGVGLGVDSTLSAWHTEGPGVGEQARCEVFCVPLGEAAPPRLVTGAGQLCSAGTSPTAARDSGAR